MNQKKFLLWFLILLSAFAAKQKADNRSKIGQLKDKLKNLASDLDEFSKLVAAQTGSSMKDFAQDQCGSESKSLKQKNQFGIVPALLEKNQQILVIVAEFILDVDNENSFQFFVVNTKTMEFWRKFKRFLYPILEYVPEMSLILSAKCVAERVKNKSQHEIAMEAFKRSFLSGTDSNQRIEITSDGNMIYKFDGVTVNCGKSMIIFWKGKSKIDSIEWDNFSQNFKVKQQNVDWLGETRQIEIGLWPATHVSSNAEGSFTVTPDHGEIESWKKYYTAAHSRKREHALIVSSDIMQNNQKYQIEGKN